MHPRVLDQLQGHCIGIEDGEPLLLPSVSVERLAEIALPVEEADAHDGNAEIARCLEVVTGEHPETAGVLRECLSDPELRRQVSDAAQAAASPPLEPPGRLEVRAQFAMDLAEESHERPVL